MKVENSDQILSNQEYEQAIEVRALPPETAPVADGTASIQPASAVQASDPAPQAVPREQASSAKTTAAAAPDSPVSALGAGAKGEGKGKGKKKPGITKVSGAEKAAAKISLPPSSATAAAQAAGVVPAQAAASPSAGPAKHEPSFEDGSGFDGRRPLRDPFRVGEVTTLELSYFNVVAGDMTLEVRPFVQVNGRKSYHFVGTAKSNGVFAMFYAVDDWVETFVDFERMIPFNYALHVKETKQLREVRSFFDWPKLRGNVWDRKIPKDKPPELKEYKWDILPYSQNVFSAPFYMRTFALTPGKKIQYRIGHEGKNLLLTAEVLRRERLSTPIGELDTLVLKPSLEIDGVFKPMGDILFWLTDDDRKFLVRIESKIKIGTVVGQVKSINKGTP